MTYAWHPFHGREFAVEPHGNTDLFRCSVVEDRRAPHVLLPQWIFDPVACSVMREVSTPVSCLSALDELRRLLLETHALDSLPPQGEERAHEQTPSPSTTSTASASFAHPPPGVERPSEDVPRRGRRTARRAPEGALEAEGRDRATRRKP